MHLTNLDLGCATFLGLPVEERRYTGNEDNEPDERLKGLSPYCVKKNAEVD